MKHVALDAFVRGVLRRFSDDADAAAIRSLKVAHPPTVSVLTRTRIHCLAYHEPNPRRLSARITLLDLHRPNATIPDTTKSLFFAAPNDARAAGEFFATVARRIGQDQIRRAG